MENLLGGEYERTVITTAVRTAFEELSVQVDDLSVVEEGEEMAIVEATVTTEILGDEQTQTQQIELRTHDGSWKIWSGAV